MARRLVREVGKKRKNKKEYAIIDGRQRILTTSCVRRINMFNPTWLLNYKHQLALGGRIIHSIEEIGNYAYITCYFIGRITALNQYWSDKRKFDSVAL